ncbi:hypothetical protein G6F68_017474 [Rhizopus microsporus]|nr:hypothetical protein G6F68_017474 [Rhizopus microsporus]
MGIFQLDGDLVREILPGRIGPFETVDDVLKGGADKEILLSQSKLLAHQMVVVRIQDRRQVLCVLLIRHRSIIVALVEGGKVKGVEGFRGPETDVAAALGAKAWDGHIVRHRLDFLSAFPGHARFSLVVHLGSHITIELDFIQHVVAWKLPRVDVGIKPVIWHLGLIALFVDQLLKDPVLIT